MRPPLPTRCRLRAPGARGFTVIEVMLALALSAIVVAAAIGLYKILNVAERKGETRFEHAADLAVTQITLRRIMNTLVCAPAQPAGNQGPADTPVDTPPETDGASEEGDNEEDAPEPTEGQAEILAEAAPSAPMMFELWWQEMELDEGTVAVPMIELVVSEAPVVVESTAGRFEEEDLEKVSDAQAEDALRRANRLTEMVRGVLEVVPDYGGWRLQWRPLEPPGQPYMFISHIATNADGGPELMWEVLSRDEKNTDDPWKDIWAAKIHAEFPQAVRLRFVTTDNEYTDWLFETHDSVQE